MAPATRWSLLGVGIATAALVARTLLLSDFTATWADAGFFVAWLVAAAVCDRHTRPANRWGRPLLLLTAGAMVALPLVPQTTDLMFVVAAVMTGGMVGYLVSLAFNVWPWRMSSE